MEHIKDPADALARKLFVWTFIYAIAFGFGVFLILKNSST